MGRVEKLQLIFSDGVGLLVRRDHQDVKKAANQMKNFKDNFMNISPPNPQLSHLKVLTYFSQVNTILAQRVLVNHFHIFSKLIVIIYKTLPKKYFRHRHRSILICMAGSHFFIFSSVGAPLCVVAVSYLLCGKELYGNRD